jgi:KUP system potassium uptake protein
MYIWYKGKQVQKKFIVQIPLQQQIPVLHQLSRDKEVPRYATHLIYLSNADNENLVEKKSIESILRSPSKKADVYWFIHINVTDEPYTMEYRVKTLSKNDVYHLTLNLGFRIEPRVDLFFRTILEELVASGEIKLDPSPDFKYSMNRTGDYKFMLGDSYLSNDNDLPKWNNLLLKFYYNIKKIAVKEEENFGLEANNVWVEKYPLIVNPVGKIWLKRNMN